VGLHCKAPLQHTAGINPKLWLQTLTFQSKGFPYEP